MFEFTLLMIITNFCSSHPNPECKDLVVKCLETKSVDDDKAIETCYLQVEK